MSYFSTRLNNLFFHYLEIYLDDLQRFNTSYSREAYKLNSYASRACVSASFFSKFMQVRIRQNLSTWSFRISISTTEIWSSFSKARTNRFDEYDIQFIWNDVPRTDRSFPTDHSRSTFFWPRKMTPIVES